MRTTKALRSSHALVATLCFAGAMLGCGDDTNDRPVYRSGVTTSDNTTTTVSTLDDDDKEQLCTSLDAHVQAYVSFDAIAYVACLPLAIVTGGSRDGCQRQLESCMSVFPEPIAIDTNVTNTSVCFSDLDDCNATVAALETCVNVNLDIVYDILDNWSCAGADNAQMRADAQAAMDDASVCADLNAACNQFATVVGPD